MMLLAGYGGMVSLAQITSAGIAAYTVAIFGTNNIHIYGFGWPWWVLVPFAVLLAAITSAVIGAISVRTEGIYTIMITLAIAAAFFYFAQQNYALFNGHSGFAGIPTPKVAGVDWRDPIPFYYLCLFVAAACYAAVLYCSRSTFGLALQAIRDNGRRMRAVGFDITAHKVVAYFYSGIIAGLAGVLLVWFNGRVSPGTVDVGQAIQVLVIAVIGGLRHPIGPFLGGQIDVAHQAEDEREAAGDQEIKSRQCHAIENRIDESLLGNENCVEPARPDREEQPGDQSGGESPHQGPRLPPSQSRRRLLDNAHAVIRKRC